jgi:intein/homing endonuclease
MKETYTESLHLSKSNIERLNQINAIIEEYRLQGYKLTLRQLYYQLVSRDVIPNKTEEYAKLSSILVKGRMAGIVDWEAIEDRIRTPKIPYYAANVADAIDDITRQYRLDRMRSQDVYVEVWCFPGNTPVVTNNGILNIEDIKTSDVVLSEDGNFNNVVNIFERKYEGKLLHIKTTGLLDIKTTPNHPFLVAKSIHDSNKGTKRKIESVGFKQASDLEKFDYLLVPRTKAVVDIKNITIISNSRSKTLKRITFGEEFCKVIGLYLSEGSIRLDDRTTQFTFHKDELEYVKIIETWGKKLGLNPFVADGAGTKIIYLSSKALSDWFKENFGNGAYKKHLPQWVMTLPMKKQMVVLKYYFAGDGSIKDITRPGIIASSKSKSLVMQLQILLIRNGIFCSVRTSHDSTGDIYRLSVNGKSGRDLRSEWNIVESIKGKTSFNHGRIDEDYVYFPIRNIVEEQFDGNVYNIEVENSHSYCLPCVVHNCEKDALSGVISRVTEKFHVRLMVNRGYSSATAMHDAAKRIIRSEKEAHILYLGDHDPSGMDMVRDIRDRLLEFNAEVKVDHIALTDEQIAKYNPPPNPAKVTDPRAGGYIATYGKTSWEVDALTPTVLNALIESKILGIIDYGKFEDILRKENLDIVRMKEFRDMVNEE